MSAIKPENPHLYIFVTVKQWGQAGREKGGIAS
jgi:hypothetical protein